jgi:PAS domain S-box-containing protein
MTPPKTKKIDYHSIYNLSPTAIMVLDANGIIIEANKTTRDWLNLKQADIRGKNIFMVRNLPKESKVKILEQFSSRSEGKPVPPYKITFQKKKGELRRGIVCESSLLNKNGGLDRILVVLADITDLDESVSVLGDDAETYKEIFDNSSIAITYVNENEKISYWNKRTEELLGKSKGDLHQKHISSLYPSEEWERIRSLNMRQKDPQQQFEAKVLKKNGETLDVCVSLSILKDKNNKIMGSVGVIRDISAQKRAEHAAHIAQNRYQTIFENSAIGIMMADANERIISWNKFTEALLGKTREDLYLKPVQSLYPEEEWGKMRSLNIRQKGIQHHLETKMFKKDGNTLDVNVSLSVLKNDVGEVTGTIGVIQDLSEVKQARKIQDDYVKMKSDFVSMVSHEIQTPIAAVKGSIEIVTDESAGPVNPEQKDFLQTAMDQLSRLENLLSDILEYQKLCASNFELNILKHEINSTLKETHSMMAPLAEDKGLTLDLQLLPEPLEMEYDQSKVKRVLHNLIENAIKFTDSGTITLTATRKNDTVEICVADTGKGIRPEDMDKLFKTFSQISHGDGRETGDTGLGLVISKLIIENHHGQIWAESEIDQGSRFIFTLPLHPNV